MISLFQAFLAFFAASPQEDPAHTREGRIARVIEPNKIWQVWYKATYWSARSRTTANFRPGDLVRVVEREGLVLFIEPLDTED